MEEITDEEIFELYKDTKMWYAPFFAIGAAAPAASEMGLLSLGNAPISARLGNAAADLGSQLTFNGFNFKEVNWSSTIANGLFGSPFTAAAVGA